MKTKIITLIALLIMSGMSLHAQDNRILVAYFSWSGNTQHVAEYIARQTGVPHRTRKAISYGIHPLHRGSQERKGRQRPPRYQEQGGRLGQLRHGVHRLPRMVVDRPDDHQHLYREL